MRRRLASLALWSALSSTAACSGSIPTSDSGHAGGSGAPPKGSSAGTSGTSGDPGMTGAGGAVIGGPAAAESAGPRPLRRLTRDEYNHTVRDLLGDATNPANAFPGDVRGAGGFFDPLAVSGVETSRYRDAAEAIAARAVTNVAKLAPCATGANAAAEEACAKTFVTSFGKRAFRRPVSTDEQDALLKLYRAVRAAPLSDDYPAAIGDLVAAMLQAPQFLYHWETPSERAQAQAGLIALDGYELASRLSYFLWSSMPDDALFAAAEAGKLSDGAELERQARRMLADGRAGDTVTSFFAQLLDADQLDHLVKDTKAYPSFDPAIGASMAAETSAFARWAVLEDGHLGTLLTSPVSFVDARLAKLYGAAGVTASTPQKVTLDGSQRFGLLTQGTFLAVQANTYETSPILRGKLVLTRLLCGNVPPPPPDVDTNVPPAKPGEQTREKFEAHESSPSCAGCHKLMDPYGFAFESYDGVGAYRTTDAGRAVKTAGTAMMPSGATLAFDGARQLVTGLATSDATRACAATQWMRYGLGRGDVAADTGSLQVAAHAFTTAADDFRELLVALVQSKTFTHRSPSEGEVLR